MSGITYGQWWGRMSSQVANENASEYYRAKTRLVSAETERIKAEEAEIRRQNEVMKAQIGRMYAKLATQRKKLAEFETRYKS